jgi:hypothetical protein
MRQRLTDKRALRKRSVQGIDMAGASNWSLCLNVFISVLYHLFDLGHEEMLVTVWFTLDPVVVNGNLNSARVPQRSGQEDMSRGLVDIPRATKRLMAAASTLEASWLSTRYRAGRRSTSRSNTQPPSVLCSHNRPDSALRELT